MIIHRFPHHAAALALCLFAFAMSALLSRTVFERLPHLEDELAYLWQARTYAGGNWTVESPAPRRAYWQPFLVDYEGQRFGKYTPGYPLLLSMGVQMGQAWIVNALIGALAVAVVYRLGRDLFGADTGLIAAALAAFSPMALLLNASLMGHTAALACALVFMWSLYRAERGAVRGAVRGRRAILWGIVGGAALGLLVANRALTGVAVALPFAAWSALRVLRARLALRVLAPLLALALVALSIAALIPIYNHAATGDPFKNLYTLVWSYDRVGFGEGAGRNVHTLEKGIRHARFDLSLTAADLFGWQLGTIDAAARDHLDSESDYYPHTGVSWLLLPLALVVGYRWRAAWMLVWLAALAVWVIAPHEWEGGRLTRDPAFGYIWVAAALGWALVPALVARTERTRWIGLLLAVGMCIIGVQVAYWIGAQRYSTRYYYEALASAAILSALPLGWAAARRGLRLPVYAAVAGLMIYSLFTYALPRIGVLHRYNLISPALIEGIEARRTSDAPVLALIQGTDVRWRSYGALMAVTSPYLDSEIVAAWEYEGGESGAVRAQILARFPDRQVIELYAQENQAWFADEQPTER